MSDSLSCSIPAVIAAFTSTFDADNLIFWDLSRKLWQFATGFLPLLVRCNLMKEGNWTFKNYALFKTNTTTVFLVQCKFCLVCGFLTNFLILVWLKQIKTASPEKPADWHRNLRTVMKQISPLKIPFDFARKWGRNFNSNK